MIKTNHTITEEKTSPQKPMLLLNEAVDEAIRRSQGYLLNTQQKDGCWVGELEADTTLESDIILLMYFLKKVDKNKLRKLSNYIKSKQLADGGWNIYQGGPAEITATVKAYFALKLAGYSQDEPFMRRAKDRIFALGGITKINTFAKIYLSIFDQYNWDGTPLILPEVIFFPKWFYFNIYEMSSWSRAILVPLSIISVKKPRVDIPKGCYLDELYPDGRDRTDYSLKGDKYPFTWRNLFLFINDLLKVLERNPLKPLRGPAIKKAERWMIDHFEKSEGLGAIFPAMVNAVFALKTLGYEDDDPLVIKAIKELEAFEIHDDDAIRVQPCFSPIWDTAIVIIALIESGLRSDHPALQKATQWLLDKEVRSYGDWSIKNRDAKPGGWYFEFLNEFYPDVDDTAMVLLALRRASHSNEHAKNAAIERGFDWMVSMQCKDGGFASFDKDNTHTLFTKVPFADHNAMIDPPSSDITARILEAMGLLGHDLDNPVAKRAFHFLRKEQEEDGSWYGRWGVNYIYGTWQALRGLKAIGEDMKKEYCKKAASWVKSVQHADGGWGETCLSYDDPSRKGIGPSTPSQTAWALMGLFASGDADAALFEDAPPALRVGSAASEAVRRGLNYLLANQREDGSWNEDAFTGTGFPKVFYLNYHMYKDYFPLLALAEYKKMVSK